MAGVWLLLAGSVTACAPSRIALDPGVRAQLPSASAIHVIVYPADPPPLMTAKALAAGLMFGAIGGAVVGARAGVIGKELMAKHNVEDLSPPARALEFDHTLKTLVRRYCQDDTVRLPVQARIAWGRPMAM
jgi:hypothetical protein